MEVEKGHTGHQPLAIGKIERRNSREKRKARSSLLIAGFINIIEYSCTLKMVPQARVELARPWVATPSR